jgi:hypothetical protein
VVSEFIQSEEALVVKVHTVIVKLRISRGESFIDV